MASSKSVIAVLDDLMFTVKINEAAKKAGVAVQFLKSEKDVLDKAREHPALVILDLNFAGVDPFSLVEKLKADGDKRHEVVASATSDACTTTTTEAFTTTTEFTTTTQFFTTTTGFS